MVSTLIAFLPASTTYYVGNRGIGTVCVVLGWTELFYVGITVAMKHTAAVPQELNVNV